jgi:hypothetical protein
MRSGRQKYANALPIRKLSTNSRLDPDKFNDLATIVVMGSVMPSPRSALALVLLLLLSLVSAPALAQGRRAAQPETFSPAELVDSGHNFFGTVSRGLALTVEEAVRRWGEPNGYVLGQEASGALFGGLRFGEGVLYTRNAGQHRVFWQGPSIGFDVGGDGARTMMLVYNLPTTQALYRRFVGMDGSAYFVGGFGMTAVMADDTVVVPIRSGVGARLGVNVGYLKFTSEPTWNPF